jgi:hypothetical protein
MTRDIRERLALFAKGEIEVRRLALNIDQTAGLPPNTAKESDGRHADYVRRFGTDCWELDALDPTIVAGLIRAEVESLIDAQAWTDAVAAEDDGRETLIKTAREWAKVEDLVRRIE